MIKGILPALVTPIDELGNINSKVLKKLVEDLIENGADGFYLCGATGEGLNLTVTQHKEMTRQTIEIVDGRVPCIVHVARTVYSEMIELAKYAESVGASALSAIPPIFFKYDEDEIYSYYERLAASVNIPIVIYNSPAAAVAFSNQLLDRLFSIPNLTSAKWTSSNYATVMSVKSRMPEANFINGPDEMLLQGLSAGCDAGIGTTYNFLLPEIKGIYNAFLAGDIEKAQRLQAYVARVCEVFQGGNIIMKAKFIMSRLGYDVYYPIHPMRRLTEKEESDIISYLQSVGMKIE